MSLILHKGAEPVSRRELLSVKTPSSTSTWHPVSHYEVACLVTDEAERCGYTITNEQYGLTPSGDRMFGVLRFHPQGHPEFAKALGIRNSHDKTFALGITAGFSVLVCDNLCFGGETTIKRKHTSGIEIRDLIPEAFAQISGQYQRLEFRIDQLRDKRLNTSQAKLQIVKAAQQGAIPSRDILNVLNEFKSPTHTEFQAPTMWHLYNSFTELAKKYTPSRADKCYRTLSTLFNLAS